MCWANSSSEGNTFLLEKNVLNAMERIGMADDAVHIENDGFHNRFEVRLPKGKKSLIAPW